MEWKAGPDTSCESEIGERVGVFVLSCKPRKDNANDELLEDSEQLCALAQSA